MRAAVEVVGTGGMEHATVRRIAERAGVDNTLITHYFGSRDGLLAETAAWVFARQLEVAEVSIEFALDPDAGARIIGTVASEPELQLFLYEMTLAARRQPELFGGVLALNAEFVERMRASLRARGLPDDDGFARFAFGLIDGLVLQQLTVASPEEVAEALAAFGDALRSAAGRLDGGAHRDGSPASASSSVAGRAPGGYPRQR